MVSIYRLFARIFPRNLKKNIVRLLQYSNIDLEVNRFLGFQLSSSLLLSAVFAVYILWLFKYNFWILFLGFFVFTQTFVYIWLVLSADKKGKFTETVLPDALQLMASNLHAGVTIDKALFIAARPEFGPFKKELDKVGKEVAVGEDITVALKNLSSRIKSARLEKAVYLIISGIKSGGDLSPLLERTSQDLRDQQIMGKKIRASIGMYNIFILIAICFASPFLLGLSTVVAEVLAKTFQTMSTPQAGSLPLALGGVSISTVFLGRFSVAFIITSSILGSLVLGLVSRGKVKEGAKYIIPIMIVATIVFFVVRESMLLLLGGVFGV